MSIPAERLAETPPSVSTADDVANAAGPGNAYRIVGEVRRRIDPLPPANRQGAARRAPEPAAIGNTADPVEPPRPIVLRPTAGAPLAVLEVRQQWEGTVESVTGEEIVALLRDMTSPANPDERAVISRDEIPDADQALVSPGAVFYWTIGYERTLLGQKSSKSSIRFRRLPAWTKTEVAALQREAEELARALALDR